MANLPPQVITKFAMPDPNAAPLNLQQLFNLANILVSSEIQGPYLNIIVQTGDPDADDPINKVWVQLDSQQRPIALKTYYNGKWRRVYNGMIGEIRGYTGNPATDFTLPEGLGKVGETYDGWHICNGKSGTPDLTDKFLVGAHMNDVDHPGYSNGWVTWVDTKSALKTGGVINFTLTEATTYNNETNDLWVGKWAANVNARDDDGQLFGKAKKITTGANSGTPDPNDPPNFLLIPGDPGRTPDTDPPIEAVPTIPPFYALAWITFVGYST